MANQIELDIQGLSHEGVGVARHDGKVIFVADALPGDRVLATITQSKRKFSQATIASLIQPSAHRVEPPCRYFATCGGCTQQHISAAGQLEFKQANLAALLQRELGDVVADDVWQSPLDGEQWHYRHRIRLQRKGESLGFFAAQSNKLVDIAQCLVLDERINNKLAAVKKLLRIIPKDCAELAIDIDAQGAIALVLFSKKVFSPAIMQQINAWSAQESVHTVMYNGKVELWRSESFVQLLNLQVANQQISYQPWHFSQAHLPLNELMVARAIAWLDLSADEQVLDLFAGVGNFTLPIAAKAHSVLAIEGLDELILQCQKNAHNNQLSNVQTQTANLFEQGSWIQQLNDADKILIDPPRAGAEFVCEQMATAKCHHLVYVSCNPATLARDSAILKRSGFSLKKVCVMNMFAQTSHVESMALFIRD